MGRSRRICDGAGIVLALRVRARDPNWLRHQAARPRVGCGDRWPRRDGPNNDFGMSFVGVVYPRMQASGLAYLRIPSGEGDVCTFDQSQLAQSSCSLGSTCISATAGSELTPPLDRSLRARAPPHSSIQTFRDDHHRRDWELRGIVTRMDRFQLVVEAMNHLKMRPASLPSYQCHHCCSYLQGQPPLTIGEKLFGS